MYERSGVGWTVSADTHLAMLLALYFRDLAGIEMPGHPCLGPLSPPVKPVATAETSPHEAAELRQEWQQWWHRLLRGDPLLEDGSGPPSFPAFNDSPTLQHLLRAHYGTAYSWASLRMEEYRELSREHLVTGRREMLERMIEDRELERDHPVNGVRLQLLELPLAEKRAWFVEPGTVLMSQELPRDEALFRSYLEPVLDLLI